MVDARVLAVPVVPRQLSAQRGRDPYPYFGWLRANAPALPELRAGGYTVWYVSRYEDVLSLLADQRLSKNPDLVPGYVSGPLGANRHLVHADPPEHARLRKLVGAAFLPRRIAALEPLIAGTARQLLDRADPAQGMDLIEDFALPLTFTLICTILGVPEQLITPATRQLLADTMVPSHASDTREQLQVFLRQLVACKRLGAATELDLLGALAHARGDRLTEEELVSTAYLLLLVGHDTTVNLIGNGMLALLRNPEQLRRLREEPELMRTGVEELLRYDSPVRNATFRVAAEPISLHGNTIQSGDIVSLLIGSANRDEARFPEPDVLDLARDPNEHLAFGRGPHFCVGAALARLEGGIAFRLLLDRLGDPRLAVPEDALRWRPCRVMRGLVSLPVTA
ncbi:cytochrome P450 [Kutzneria viridogrisea]|uniref:Cytochrome P450 n=1 Tax=Kutzneria viridogrisea TaxID=47990 RepID=A0ABR6BGU2_9PSEU|nr:cytochrome P450 [Kutzneria viridogrisea]